MANEEHVKKLQEGVSAWNQWREQNPEIQPDLCEANLRRANLRKANLRKANLRGADLAFADLVQTNLFMADLSEAHLRGANLSGAGLREANLSEAHLSEAHLRGANLAWVNLSRADLREAKLDWANLFRVNLCEANLRETHLNGADLSSADLSSADLTGADLSGADCVQTHFSNADLTGCKVYGISVWDVDLQGAMQQDLRITPLEADSAITVDNLEVAQFLYLLVHNEKARAVLDTITSKVVLILGRFADRKPILDALRDALRRHSNGYIPVLFDFDPQKDKPVLETVKILANLARFIIADLTDPHMVRAELTIILPNVPTVPVKPIIEGDAELPTEYSSWVLYRSFLPLYRYADLSQLLGSLTESVIEPVEAHVNSHRLNG